MNEARQQMLTNGSRSLNECRTSVNSFLTEVINDWSRDCQNKTDIELAKTAKRIRKLEDDFNKAIGTYEDAVEFDASY